MGSGIVSNKKRTQARPEHFFKAFDLCINNRMTKNMAVVMARGFSKRGLVDAQEGCCHYALVLFAKGE